MSGIWILVAALLLLASSGDALASISVAKNAARPALRVDAGGNAEVSWSAGSVRHTLRVPATGLYLPGGKISGPDVSRPTVVPGLAFARVVRRGPDGTIYALQAWSVQPRGPVELHFSRWRGAPTTVELVAEPAPGSDRLVGSASFQGKPVAGTSLTNSGIRYRIYAFLDCFSCRAPVWRRMSGVAPRAGGMFRLLVKPGDRGSRYRVTIAGPNRGNTLAPDASATAPSST